MRKLFSIFSVLTAIFMLYANPVIASGGFDQYGYNDTARLFNGPASGWCLAKGYSADCLGPYSQDRLTMKWNAEWDRGNKEGWANGPYDAWLDNEWNGQVQNGSGVSEHVKIVWVGSCGADYTPLSNGGYCIWGQFEAISDHTTCSLFNPLCPNQLWAAKATPAGYGAYFTN